MGQQQFMALLILYVSLLGYPQVGTAQKRRREKVSGKLSFPSELPALPFSQGHGAQQSCAMCSIISENLSGMLSLGRKEWELKKEKDRGWGEFPAGLSFISSICCTQQPLSQLAQCVCRAGSGLVLPLPLGQQQCVVPKLHGKVSVVVISTVCSSVVCRIRKAETTVALLQPGCFREGFLQWKGHWRFKMIAAFEAQPISAALLFFSRDLINAGSLKLQELLAFRSQLAAPSVKEDLCVWQEGRWAACNQDRQSSRREGAFSVMSRQLSLLESGDLSLRGALLSGALPLQSLSSHVLLLSLPAAQRGMQGITRARIAGCWRPKL
ncbi:m7GpppX diphosphatase isoform X1 [Lagopus leucura]|uniref:m7GpppX diphosphatase isoform X1 n=1 Tax=Lagopus leucura TaxID=30410 RepID=UPI001C674AE2|nr:m7GpppX diphosphatase isoform X1 [Lagopus leucura]